MAGVPAYSAARSGVLGDLGATDASAQINQFLGTHGVAAVYTGTAVVSPTGTGATPAALNLGTNDYDQPFTMSGTAVGRVTIPITSYGNAADLVVSLCPDSSGTPGAPLVSTRIAAAWFAALAATGTLAAGSAAPPLATATTNILAAEPAVTDPYATPAVSASGVGTGATTVAVGTGNMLLVGGSDALGNSVANVFSVAYAGAAGLAAAVPQPSMPAGLLWPGAAATPTTLVVAGGTTTAGASVTDVFTASLNSATGAVSSWSAQAALPVALQYNGVGAATAANGADYVYVLGGSTDGTNDLASVYWARVQNGQVSAWASGPPLPTTMRYPTVSVINGFLVASGSGSETNVYYAPINADGSLGGWLTAPSIPRDTSRSTAVAAGTGLIALGQYFNGTAFVNTTETLTFGATGPAGDWHVWDNGLDPTVQATQAVAFPSGIGTWQLFSIFPSDYLTSKISLTPAVSVPLPATGLTNGATYHITISQQGGDLNDYLAAASDTDVYTGTGPTALYRARSGGSGWTATTAGVGIPVTVYDQTASGTMPLHLWADSGAKHDMLINATTPDGTLLGYLEATEQPAPVLNVNPTFTTGTAPWIVTGGTLTQSSAHTHGNLPAAGLLTPSGVDSLSYCESDQVPVYQGHDYTASVWVYSPTGYSQCAVNINWHDANGFYLSRVTGTVTSVPAGVWTELVTASSGGIPASAAYASMIVVESGTPPTSAELYFYAAIQDASGPMLPSVAQISYSGSWPAAVSQPLGITQLA